MVKPETIRKGSKVYFYDTRDEPVTVLDKDSVNGDILVKLNKIVRVHADELFPVPLTPELIMRSGFIKTDQFSFEHPQEDIHLDYDHNGVTHMHVRKNGTFLQMTSLHELQYAFWTYTNKDLVFV